MLRPRHIPCQEQFRGHNRNDAIASWPTHGIVTIREREVLAMLAADATLYEIAARLSISHATVRNHVQHILSKLGVHSILEAVAVWLVDTRRS